MAQVDKDGQQAVFDAIVAGIENDQKRMLVEQISELCKKAGVRNSYHAIEMDEADTVTIWTGSSPIFRAALADDIIGDLEDNLAKFVVIKIIESIQARR